MYILPFPVNQSVTGCSLGVAICTITRLDMVGPLLVSEYELREQISARKAADSSDRSFRNTFIGVVPGLAHSNE